jgi:isopenicillin N synthase-like dioxygenase
MDDLPLIDLGSPEDELARQVEAACRDIGFMYVTGHGISAKTVTAVRDAVVAYFDKPFDLKLADSITRDNYRGYIPTGFFTPNTGDSPADSYEGYKLHFEISRFDPVCGVCDLYGPNKWPEAPDGFREAILEFWSECDRVSSGILKILATILEVDPEWFVQLFDKPLTNMTLLHYPPQAPDETGFGIHPHKDTDALTILVPDRVGGLMVRKRGADQWLEVNAPGDALVVNIGDLLELWSGGYFVSTPHKVVNQSGRERYSFPYFAVPRYDVAVEPLRQPQPGFDRASVHVGDVSREVWRTNWPDSVPSQPEFDLGTLAD